jgi:hypothetical protein
MHFSRFYSDVNGPGLPQWNEYDIIKGHYINLDINITTGQHLYENRIKFWLNDVPTILSDTSASCSISYGQVIQLLLLCIVLLLTNQVVLL